MNRTTKNRLARAGAVVVCMTALMFPPVLRAHCDSLDGPVVNAARAALQKKDVTPVLKWVKQQSEPEVKRAFDRTLAVRLQGEEARALADQFFFETVVRLHRAGEGAPFTGLKPAGTETGPAIQGADQALQSGDISPVLDLLTAEAAEGARKRFAEVQEKKKHAEQNVAAGREYVAAYVEYVHYLEGLHQAAKGVAQPESSPGQTKDHQEITSAAETHSRDAHVHK